MPLVFTGMIERKVLFYITWMQHHQNSLIQLQDIKLKLQTRRPKFLRGGGTEFKYNALHLLNKELEDKT